jgi:hypothetical protein
MAQNFLVPYEPFAHTRIIDCTFVPLLKGWSDIFHFSFDRATSEIGPRFFVNLQSLLN